MNGITIDFAICWFIYTVQGIHGDNNWVGKTGKKNKTSWLLFYSFYACFLCRQVRIPFESFLSSSKSLLKDKRKETLIVQLECD